MYCPNCGAETHEKAVVCIKCGVALGNTTQQRPGTDRQMPKTWLVESILVTLFCCLPFGIAGIVNAANVSSRYSAGDIDGAISASLQAGKWTKWAFVTGLVGGVVYVVLMAVLGAFSALLE
jgi:hypothetical protein